MEVNLTDVLYRDEIARQHGIPFIHKFQSNVILQQDIALLHTARVPGYYLQHFGSIPIFILF